jgi:uncharacterized protein YecT (DUF1311 family)
VIARTDDLREMAAGPPNQPREELRSRLQAADANLNKMYQECIERLSPGEIKVLRDAQRAWVKFRDENARANYKPSPTGEALAASLSCHLASYRTTPKPFRRRRRFDSPRQRRGVEAGHGDS